MKKIDTSHISATAGLPVGKIVLDHVNNMVYDSVNQIVFNKLGVIKKPTVLYGVDFSLVGTTLSWTFGAISYNGEIFVVPDGSVTSATSFVLAIDTTYVDGSPGLQYTDNTYFQTLADRKMKFVSGASGSGVGGADGDYDKIYTPGKWKTSTSTTGSSIFSPTGTLISLERRWIESERSVTMNFRAGLSFSGSGTPVVDIKLPVNALFAHTDYCSASMDLTGGGTIACTGSTFSSTILQVSSFETVTGIGVLIGSITYEKA